MDAVQHAVTLQLWHVLLGVLSLLGAWIGYDRHYNAPERKRRGEVETRLALVEDKLRRGERRMDKLDSKDEKVLEAVQGLTAAVADLRVVVEGLRSAFKHSVFRGVGEKS